MVTRKKKTSRLDNSAEFAAFIDRIKADGIQATPAQVRKLKTKLKQMESYQPKIGVLGKTGVGKSSLCNALFGQRTAKVSNVKACTRSPQEMLVNLTPDGAGMTLVDVPGVGESEERDIEYQELYERLIPELDLVLWVLKGDDRAFSVDQRFYQEVVLPVVGKREIIFVVNQVDKIAPFREWDVAAAEPGKRQALNIKKKVADVGSKFKSKRGKTPTVVAVSADERYGLVDLVNTIVDRLPDAKKFGFAREVRDEHVSPKAELKAKRGIWNELKVMARDILVDHAPVLIKALVEWIIKSLPGALKAVR
ncbi:GTPase family protein [Pseudoduganella sp. GCM10020061]|uniref:GTPase family protein n=1 Tax=Pseudoduganella sp. GCM10020061 TaxID=3317345 RepID=UPI00363E0E0C